MYSHPNPWDNDKVYNKSKRTLKLIDNFNAVALDSDESQSWNF